MHARKYNTFVERNVMQYVQWVGGTVLESLKNKINVF